MEGNIKREQEKHKENRMRERKKERLKKIEIGRERGEHREIERVRELRQ